MVGGIPTWSSRRSSAVRAALVVLPALSLVTAVVPAPVGPAPASVPASASGPTPVDGCTTISTPGVYRLTADVETETAACLVIRSNDVVVDGGGHLLDGRGVAGSAAVVVGPEGTRSNVTVRDLRVREWAYGVRAENDTGVTLDGVNARFTVSVASFVRAADVVVTDTRVENVYDGLSFVNSSNVTVEGFEGEYATFTPLFVAGSTDVTVRNTSVSHAGDGVVVLDAEHVSMTRVTATDARRSGVSVSGSADVRLAGATFGGNVGEYSDERTPVGVVTRETADLAVAESTGVRASLSVRPGSAWSVDLGGNVSDVRVTVAGGDARPFTVGGHGVRVGSASDLLPCPPGLDPLHRPVRVTGTAPDAAVSLAVGTTGTDGVSAWAAPDDEWVRLDWTVDTDRESASVSHPVVRDRSRYVLSELGSRGDEPCTAAG